jgi:uncharacterized protein (TIGR02598 family)
VNKQTPTADGFSLVEVTLALGVAGFCLIALMALLPIGIKTNQTAFSQTAAATILSDVVADLRATPNPPSINTSAQYKITFDTSKTLYFDSEGRCSTDVAGSIKPDGSSWSPPIQTRYRLVVTFPVLGTNPTYAKCANVKISWPAVVDPTSTTTKPAGSIETVSAFDRL